MRYVLGYAKYGTSKCKGAKPCKGSSIIKGSLRFGTQVTIQGKSSFVWRHHGCMTAEQFENIQNDLNEADDVDGFEDLTPKDQKKFRKAFAKGHVADGDIPDTARENSDSDEDVNPHKKLKKAALKKRAAKKQEESDEEEEVPKPTKKVVKKRKAQKKVESDEAESEEEEKPKKQRGRKSVAKKQKV